MIVILDGQSHTNYCTSQSSRESQLCFHTDWLQEDREVGFVFQSPQALSNVSSDVRRMDYCIVLHIHDCLEYGRDCVSYPYCRRSILLGCLVSA
jgi:hypothetical protein